MLGTDKLQSAVKLGIALFNQAKEATGDGFQVMDIFSFVDELTQLPGIINSAEAMKQELNDLDLNERAEILQLVKDGLQIDDAKAEDVVVAILDMIFALYKGVSIITGKAAVN